MATLEELLAQAETESAASQAVGTPGQQALQAGTGALLNVFDQITSGLLGKGLATGYGITADLGSFITQQPPGPAYDEALAKIERLKAIGERGTSEAGLTGLSEALGFMAPLPGKKAETLMSLAKPAKEAGLGLASYFGSEAGQALTDESPYGSLAGALLAPLSIQGLVGGTKKLVNALSPTAKLIVGNEEALRAAANESVLQAVGDEGLRRLDVAQQMPNLGVGAGGVPLTLAEIAQTPSAAKYQQSFLNKGEAGNIIRAALDARTQEVNAAVERLGITPQTGEMSLMMQDAAQLAAAQKQAEQAKILNALGFDETVQAQTAMERGKVLQESLFAKKEDVEKAASDIWKAVPKATKLDASTPFAEAIRTFENFGELTKADTSAAARRVMNKVYDIAGQKNGIVDVGELQDIRAAAGRAMTDASGKNAAEVKLMKELRESIDKAGLEYFYDPSVGMKGGLPGTAKTAPDLEALTKLSNAIEATRSAKQTFSQGVVGDLTAISQFKPRVQTSRVMNKAVEKPENIIELSDKFGFNSSEMTEVRTELLARLTKASNPTEFLGREKAKFQAAFKDQYKTIESFAQKAGQKAPMDEYLRLGDSAIPNKVFANEKSAAKFARQFKDSPVLQMGRAKFISERLTKRGNALDNLQKNKTIARQLFGDDLPKLEKTLKDLQISKSPAELERIAASGNSITSVRQTALGAVVGARGVINMMKTGRIAGPIIGSSSVTGALIGYNIGNWMKQIGEARGAALDAFEAELMANPRLIKLASAPPTKENISNLMEAGMRLGYFGAKSQFTTDEDELAAQQLLNSL